MNNPTRYTDPGGYQYIEHDDDPKPLLSRLTPWTFTMVTPKQYDNSTPNVYFYGGNGIYYNYNGDVVPFGEVLNNYLIPGSALVYSSQNPFSVADAMKDGWRFYNVQAFNNNHVMFVKGDLGSISPSANGGITFSNPTASATFLNDWEFSEGSGETSWSDISSGVGISQLIVDAGTETADYMIRNNYQSANSWSGFMKLRAAQQEWRTINTLGENGANILKLTKVTGPALGLVSTVISANIVYSQFKRGQEINPWDVSDIIVGGTGTVAGAVLTFGLTSNPIGWGIVATGATIYGIVRVGMWLCE